MIPTDRDGDRHSHALTPSLITDPQARAERESANGLEQVRVLYGMIDEWLAPERRFRLRPSMILGLQRAALEGLSAYAGSWRPAGGKIHGSGHAPPPAHLVPELIEELCDYVNDHWNESALHLASYAMWRMNWIHPFDDGNGRTARAVSYLVLSIKLGYRPPGEPTIPDQIVGRRAPYYEALEAADRAFAEDRIDVSTMEKLLQDMLVKQLFHVVERASGRPLA